MTGTRWLDDEQQATWRAFLAATRALAEELDRQLQRDAGIPLAYYEILVRLSEAPGRTIRMSELADLTGSSPSRLSHAVTRLETRGWVERTQCPTDRRGLFAVLTDEGFAALEAAAPGHVETVRALLFDPLSEDQVTALREISERVHEHIRPEGAASRSLRQRAAVPTPGAVESDAEATGPRSP